ncbi:saccharopine dehydrogenase family protein [Streptomyces sp. NRRL F-5630]|uniref:saccharopine dehydrogenase family protein n=1 Tax=Streptomyces sp. NRRL F-5630 TaxID=1463864 RepID=UPI003EBCF586
MQPNASPTRSPEAARKEREFDLVLYGASGFAGALTAAYLAGHAPPSLRWALAGRSAEKLERTRASLGLKNVPVLAADAGDPAALRELAARTRVLATTVGPYLRHGDALVGACADAGTDYADLAGEPEFVDRSYLRHEARARATGARLVHGCGFDSVPADLGVLFTVGRLPEGVPLRVDGFLAVDAAPSGGTVDSALSALGRPLAMARAARERAAVEAPPGPGRRVTAPPGPPRYVGELGAWAFPLPVLDPLLVARSARALPRYGPDFRYRHHVTARRLPTALAGLAGATALLAAAQLPPLRRALSARLAPGTGPSEERRARSTFSLRFIGEGGGRRVYTEIRGGDPGYDETARILGESALCLALDALPPLSGQLTPAVAMGEALTERLRNSGLMFREAARRED